MDITWNCNIRVMDTGEYRSLFICKWVSIRGIILCAYAGYQDIVLGLNRSGSMSTGPNSFSAIIALAAPFVLLNIPNLLINIVNWLIFLEWYCDKSVQRLIFGVGLCFISLLF